MEEKTQAIIEHDGDCKYILARISDGQESTLVIASWRRDNHVDIASDYWQRLQNEGKRLCQILGGGRLVMNKDGKEIETYDQSGSYGDAPLDLVEKVLRENFPDYKLDIR